MSYDLRIGVRIDGTDMIAEIAEPDRPNPTHNLGKMFRECMGWDFQQSQWYSVAAVYPLIQRGLSELIAYPEKYRKYESENKWGTVETAVKDLQSLKDCIDQIESQTSWRKDNTIPKQYLWVAW